MPQIVICRSLFTLNVILNLVLYAVNINDIHVLLLLLLLLLFIYLFFIRQSVIVFQEIGKNKKIKKKRKGKREKEEDRYIS